MNAAIGPCVRLASGNARRAGAILILLVLAGGCRSQEPPATPPFSLEQALPILAPYTLDDVFLGNLQAVKERAGSDPAFAAAYARFALGGVAAGMGTGSPAVARIIGAEGRDPATVGRFLAAVAATAKGAPAPLPAALISLASAWGAGSGDLSAALAYAASEAEGAPAVRAVLARKLLDGLRTAGPAPESERGRVLQDALPGLPSPMVQEPRATVFPTTLRTLATILRQGAGADKGLAATFSRLAEDANTVLGRHAYPVPVSPGPEPRPGTPASGVPGVYMPLLVLSLDAEGVKAGVRPTFGWNGGKVDELSAVPGFPGAVAVPVKDLESLPQASLDAGKTVLAKALAVAESLEPSAFSTGAGTGLLSADRGDRGRPALILAAGDRPAIHLQKALVAAEAAGLVDLRLLPPGPMGRSLPVFLRTPRTLPGADIPKGPRVLVVVTPDGADIHPPAKAVLPVAGWPEGVQAAADGKKLYKLSVGWTAERGFGGRVGEAIGAIRAKVPTAPLVDVIIRSKDVTVTETLDIAAEVLGSPGARFDLLSVYFPGVSCAQGGACPSAVPILFSDAPAPRAAKPQAVMAETRPSGFCEKGAVQRVVMGRSGAYRACFEAELQRYGSLAGRLELRFTIEPDGSVTGVTPTMNELNKSVEACIVRQVSQLKFPKPDGGVCIIRWPFRFQPGG